MSRLLRLHNLSLTARLTVLFVLLAAVPISLVSVIEFDSERAEILAEVDALNLRHATDTAHNLDSYFQDLMIDTRLAGETSENIALLMNPQIDQLLVRSEESLRQAARVRGFDLMFLTDLAGTVLASTDPNLRGTDFSTMPGVRKAAAGEPTAGELAFDDTDQASMYCFYPVRAHNGQILGIAVIRHSTSMLDRIIASDGSHGEEGTFAVLWDGNGTRISDSAHSERRGADVFPELGRMMGAVQLGRDDHQNGTKPSYENLKPFVIQRITRQLIEDRDSIAQLLFHSSEHGTTRGAVVPLASKAWIYGVFTPERGALAMLTADLLRQAGVAALAGLIAVALAFVAARFVSGPIQLVAEASQALARGERSRPLSLKRRDEIGQLASSFDAMAAALAAKEELLRSQMVYLERAVEHRTRELQRLNGLHQALSEMNKVTVRATCRDDLYAEACRIAVERARFAYAWVGMIDRATSTVVPVAIHGSVAGYLDNITVSTLEVPEGRGPAGTAARTGICAVFNDMEHQAVSLPWREKAIQAGFRSQAAFPLEVRGEVVGVLVTYASETNYFGPDEVQLLTELASDLSLALDFLLQEELRQKAEAALAESEERFRSLIEAAPTGITLVRGTTILFANRSIKEIFGYGATDQVEGRSILEHVAPEQRQTIAANSAARERGEVMDTSYESMGMRVDGTRFPMELHASQIVLPDGPAVIVFLTDVTERKQLAEKLLQAQRLEMAGRVAGQVAHDFNNLLGPMAAYPDLIKMHLPPDHQAAEFCDQMSEAASQMAAINEDLLAFGRRGHVGHEQTEINLLVEQALAQLNGSAAGILVRAELAPDLPAVSGSAPQLLRIVSNLVSNAREAMPDGGSLTLRTSPVRLEGPFGRYPRVEPGDYVRLEVSDTGCGIPSEVRDRVFEPFFTTRSRAKKPGSGLGLSIVQAVVDDHHGYLDLTSKAGEGTTFSVYLPVSREPARVEPAPALPRGRETILVVDDDSIQRDVTRHLLQTLGYRVHAVASGEAAVETLRERSADLVMLDMVMSPGIDGAETYRRIVEIRPGQKAIVLSGYAESGRVEEARRLGAGAFLRKPVTIERLARAVREELDGRVNGEG